MDPKRVARRTVSEEVIDLVDGSDPSGQDQLRTSQTPQTTHETLRQSYKRQAVGFIVTSPSRFLCCVDQTLNRGCKGLE
jgi:hypothetical protein